MDGDGMSEGVLTDIAAPSLPGLCNRMVESVFEYGSRVGGWRLLRLSGVKVCLLAVAKAVERNPEITRAFVEDETRYVGAASPGQNREDGFSSAPVSWGIPGQ